MIEWLPQAPAHSENPGIEPGQLRPPAWACSSEQGMGPLGVLNPQRLWDRLGSSQAGPASCQNHPALGCRTPSCLLLQLCSVSSAPEVSSPQAQKARSHPRPRSTLDPLSLQKLDLLVDSDSGLQSGPCHLAPTTNQMALAG